MMSVLHQKKLCLARGVVAQILLVCFFVTTMAPLSLAQEIFLPVPGSMVHLSPSFNPPILKGIKVYPDNPFLFDFILDNGQNTPSGDDVEAGKLVRYFLASLTTPENDMWVNLSPYEKDRIVPESFGQTEMGRDLLAQDYILKQITASLIYPEDELGKKFWERVYAEAQRKFGTTDIPVNTFNKVWIVPAKAVVYENPQNASAYVVDSKLKVMLEEDYIALANQKDSAQPFAAADGPEKIARKDANAIGSQIVREIVIPALTKEVNEGKNFSQLRQIYNSLILASWYKKKIKDSLLSQVYVDKNKVAGVDIDDPQEKQVIYEQYLEAFKKGAYNYIKEEADPVTKDMIPKKYFSGGFSATAMDMKNVLSITASSGVLDAVEPIKEGNGEILQIKLASSVENSFRGQVGGERPVVASSGVNIPPKDQVRINEGHEKYLANSRAKLKRIPQVKSFPEAIEKFNDPQLRRKFYRFTASDEDVLAQMASPSLNGLGYEFMLFRLKGKQDWVVLKVEERGWGAPLPQYITRMIKKLSDISIHNHPKETGEALPSTKDLNAFWFGLQDSDRRDFIRSDIGIVEVDMSGGLRGVDTDEWKGKIYQVGLENPDLVDKETSDPTIKGRYQQVLDDLFIVPGYLKLNFTPFPQINPGYWAPSKAKLSDQLASPYDFDRARAIRIIDDIKSFVQDPDFQRIYAVVISEDPSERIQKKFLYEYMQKISLAARPGWKGFYSEEEVKQAQTIIDIVQSKRPEIVEALRRELGLASSPTTPSVASSAVDAMGTDKERAQLLVSVEDRFEKPYSQLVQKPERELNENVAERNSAVEIQMELDRLLAELGTIVSQQEIPGLFEAGLDEREAGFLRNLRSLYQSMPVPVHDELSFAEVSQILKDLRASRNRIYAAIEKADRESNIETLKDLNRQAIRNNRLILKAQVLIAGKMMAGKSNLKGRDIILGAVGASLNGAMNTAQQLKRELGYRIGRLQAAKMVREIETTDWLGRIIRTYRMSGFDIEVSPKKEEGQEPTVTVRQQYWVNAHTRLDQILTELRAGRVGGAQIQLDNLFNLYNVKHLIIYEKYRDISEGIRQLRERTSNLQEGHKLSPDQAKEYSDEINKLKDMIDNPKQRVWVDVEIEDIDAAFRSYLHRFAGYIEEIGTISYYRTTLEFFASLLKDADKVKFLSKRNLAILLDGLAPIVDWAQRGMVYQKQRVVINLEPAVEKINGEDYSGAQEALARAAVQLQERLKEIESIVASSKKQAASVFSAYRDKDIGRRAEQISKSIAERDFETAFLDLETLLELYFNQDQVEPGYVRAGMSVHKLVGLVRAAQRMKDPSGIIAQSEALLKLVRDDVAHKYSLKVYVVDNGGKKTFVYVNPGTTVAGFLKIRGIDPQNVQVSLGAKWIKPSDLSRTRIPEKATVIIRAVASSGVEAPASYVDSFNSLVQQLPENDRFSVRRMTTDKVAGGEWITLSLQDGLSRRTVKVLVSASEILDLTYDDPLLSTNFFLQSGRSEQLMAVMLAWLMGGSIFPQFKNLRISETDDGARKFFEKLFSQWKKDGADANGLMTVEESTAPIWKAVNIDVARLDLEKIKASIANPRASSGVDVVRLSLTERDLRSFGVLSAKEDTHGTQAYIYKKEGWPFVLKLFVGNGDIGIFSQETQRAYDLAYETMGGIVHDFIPIQVQREDGMYLYAVIMRKVPIDDLAIQMENLMSQGQESEAKHQQQLENIKKLIDQNVELVLEILSRGVFPIDIKFKNFGMDRNRQVVIDPGFFESEYREKKNMLTYSFQVNFNFLKDTLGSEELAQYYRSRLNEAGLWKGDDAGTISGLWQTKSSVRRVRDISMEVEASFKGQVSVEYLSSSVGQKDYFISHYDKANDPLTRAVLDLRLEPSQLKADDIVNQNRDLIINRLPKSISNVDMVVGVPPSNPQNRTVEYLVNALADLLTQYSHKTISAGHGILLKTRATERQYDLAAEQRADNVRDAFTVDQDLTGKNVLLLDDVRTTGFTLQETRKVLEDAGAKVITVSLLQGFVERIKANATAVPAASSAVTQPAMIFPGGGRLFTRYPVTVDFLKGSDGKQRLSDNAAGELKMMPSGYEFLASPLKVIQSEIGVDLVEKIAELDQQRSRSEFPQKMITVVEWGAGAATALREIKILLDRRGIRNVRLVGFSDTPHRDWLDLPSGIDMIFGKDLEIGRYFAPGEVNMFYSRAALRYLAAPEYYRQLAGLLKPEGKIFWDGDVEDITDIKATGLKWGSEPSQLKMNGYSYYLQKPAVSSAVAQLAVKPVVSSAVGTPLSALNKLSPEDLRVTMVAAYQNGLVPRKSLFEEWKRGAGENKVFVAGAVILKKVLIDGTMRWGFLLAKRGPQAADNRGEYSFPAGKLEKRAGDVTPEQQSSIDKLIGLDIMDSNDVPQGYESTMEALGREVREELRGLSINPSDISGRINDYFDKDNQVLVNLGVYVDTSSLGIEPDGKEISNVVFVPVDLLFSGVDPGENVSEFLSKIDPGSKMQSGLINAGLKEIRDFFLRIDQNAASSAVIDSSRPAALPGSSVRILDDLTALGKRDDVMEQIRTVIEGTRSKFHFPQFEDPSIQESLKGINPFTKYALAVDPANNKVIGYAFYEYYAPGIIYVSNIGVLDEYRRSSVGLQLMGKVFEYARSAGISKVRLKTSADAGNTAADFYRKLSLNIPGISVVENARATDYIYFTFNLEQQASAAASSAIKGSKAFKGKDFSIDDEGFLDGRIDSPEFIAREKSFAEAGVKTIAIDLESTIGDWQIPGRWDSSLDEWVPSGEPWTFVVRSWFEREIAKLHQAGYRLVIWTKAGQKITREDFLEKNPQFKKYFDLVISRENFVVENDLPYFKLDEMFNDPGLSSSPEKKADLWSRRLNGGKDIIKLGYTALIDDMAGERYFEGHPEKGKAKTYRISAFNVGLAENNKWQISDNEPDTENFAERIIALVEGNAPAAGLPVNNAASSALNVQNDGTKGGIDFNNDKLNLETRTSGGEIHFEMDTDQLRELQNVPGFTPIIINIQPMINVRMFLGLKEKGAAPLEISKVQ